MSYEMTDEDREKYQTLEECIDSLRKHAEVAKRRGWWDNVKEAREGIREARYKQRLLETGRHREGWGGCIFVLIVAGFVFTVTMLIHYF